MKDTILNDVAKAISTGLEDGRNIESMVLAEPREVTIAKKRSALRTLLEPMDIPDMRRDTSKRANIHWLNRNLGINNAENPMLPTARSLVRWLLKDGV